MPAHVSDRSLKDFSAARRFACKVSAMSASNTQDMTPSAGIRSDRAEAVRPPLETASPDAGEFDWLVREHGDRVARLAQRLLGWRKDVDDVVQDVFVKALEQHHRFRGESRTGTWLARITINACRTRLRRERLWRVFFLARSAEPEPTHAANAVADETGIAVRRAVNALPQRLREVVVLRYLEGWEVERIAQTLGLKRGAVDTRLSRARSTLERELRDWWEERP